MTDRKQLIIDNSGEEPLSNFSDNRTFASVLAARMERRALLKGGIGAAMAGFFGASLVACSSDGKSDRDPKDSSPVPSAPLMGFSAIATGVADAIRVPEGYTAKAFIPWGTPICGSYPEYRADGTNSGEDQEQQIGMHHDGMHFFPIDVRQGGNSSDEGLLVLNHEYIDEAYIHAQYPEKDADGKRPADEVRKEIAAHGVSVVHIRKNTEGEWEVVHGSPYNRRITGATPMELRGPVRGSDLVKTKYSPDGTEVRGTINNCANGFTPWGTYLAAEENWAGYFVNKGAQPREHSRYGVPSNNGRYSWELADSEADEYIRFDATAKGTSATEDYRNEPNAFGWMVEIDPFAPESKPQKRTALGRFGHEGVVFGKVEEGKPIVCYSGDDARFEYIYKYVSKELYYKSTAGGHLLNDGTLYVARFNEDGTGEWLELTYGKNGLDESNGFYSQADVLVNTRTAADLLGPTKMDRPEWGAVHPETGEVYFTLTNNTRRTEADAANPRVNNAYGHIIRWREDGEQAATTFKWDIYLLAGPAGTETKSLEGETLATLTDDNKFNSPDGLWIDPRGLMWIQTDKGGTGTEEFGNDQMLAADPVTREVRRFLTGPVGCEVTGITATPDLKTMFINIQHPGEGSPGSSDWPDGGGARPRSATVIITKDDGGVIGT